eukprot:COSAG04_NODE_8896_length_920_cov_0.583435_2_plen_39_part_01
MREPYLPRRLEGERLGRRSVEVREADLPVAHRLRRIELA